ncbi:MAG: two-component regulator propeller domain-containing protein [Niabella sp.]
MKLTVTFCLRPSIILLILLGIPVAGFSQAPLFNRLSMEQGLSQNTVLAIAQDSQGFMWLGTRYGLNRYDGYQFKVYKNNPQDSSSISNNFITAIVNDTVSGLWIGTESGLNRYNAVNDNFERFLINNNKSSARSIIRALCPDGNGKIWVCASNGLFLADPKTKKIVSAVTLGIVNQTENQSVRNIYKDSKQTLWIAADEKLIRFSKNTSGSIKKIYTYKKGNPTGISNEMVTAFYEDKKQQLWIGTLDGLNLYNRETENFRQFKNQQPNPSSLGNNNIRSFTEDTFGNLWIATLEGVTIMNTNTYECKTYKFDEGNPYSISQNSAYSLYTDKFGCIWVGTFYGGANVVYNPQLEAPIVQQLYTSPTISNNIVSSVVVDYNNNLWIGTEGGGLNYVNKKNGSITIFRINGKNNTNLSSNLIKNIYIDKNKNVWVGTHGGGINVLHQGEKGFRRVQKDLPFNENPHSEVVDFLQDRSGLFWIAAHPGLFVFEKNNTVLNTAPLQKKLLFFKTKNINYLSEDAKGNIWIGTLRGLYILNKKSNQIDEIKIKSNSNNINCIFSDSKNNIWVGLNFGGLAKYNERSKQVEPVTNILLPNDNVVGILEDNEKNLWISTSNGLLKLNPKTNETKIYTKSDGLPGNEFNLNAFFKDDNGEMFFGGMKGLFSFFPNSIKENKTLSPLVFTGLKILNASADNNNAKILDKDINYTHQIQLKNNQRTFSISFALLNFIKPDKNIYAYKLEKVHSDWIHTNTPVATFTSLAPGSYTLLIKAANNDGFWSKPRALRITILPPIWQTWWAYTLYTIALLTILFFIVRFFYMRALLARDHELHELKLNFFTNISHEIKTHLTLIKSPVDGMERDNHNNPGLMRQLAHLKNNTNQLLLLVDELMEFRKAETNSLKLHVAKHNLIDFLNLVYEPYEELAIERGIQSSIVYNTNSIPLYFDSEQMKKVVDNLLINAFKFTQKEGSVNLYIEEKKDAVLIHFVDNGQGIEAQFIDKIFTNYFQVEDNKTQNSGYGIGLALCKAIISLHKGTITVHSVPAQQQQNGFTRFTVTLLKGKNHFASEQIFSDDLQENKLFKDVVVPNQPELISAKELETASQYTILIVEDNKALRGLLKETLNSFGYCVQLCANGEEGWQEAITNIPDLIISDVMMPVMNGLVLCNQLKNDARTSHIPVILLTARNAQADHIEGLTTGADIYITKPFCTDILVLNVRNLLVVRETMRNKFSNEFTLDVSKTIVESPDKDFLQELIDIIETHLEDADFGVETLSTKIAMSQSVLYKKLRAVANMSVNEFIKTIRLKKAAQLLCTKQYSVSEVSLQVGFLDNKYFSREFKKHYGSPPSKYAEVEGRETGM